MNPLKSRFAVLEHDSSKIESNSFQVGKTCRKIHPVVEERAEILQMKRFLRVLKNRSKTDENCFDTFFPVQSKLLSVSVNHDNSLLLCTFSDSRAKLYDLIQDSQEVQEIPSTTEASCCCFSANSSEFAIGSKEIRLFSLPVSQISVLPAGHSKIKKLSYSNSCRFLLSLYSDNLIKVWNIERKEACFSLDFDSLTVFSVSLSIDDSTLAIGTMEKSLKLWNIKKKSEIKEMNLHTSALRSLAFSPDGNWLVTGSQDRNLKAIDLASQEVRISLRCKTGYSVSLEFSQDSKLLLAGLSSSFINLWNSENWTMVFNVFLNFSPESPVTLSPDGSKILSVNKDNSLKIMDVKENRTKEILRFSNEELTDAGFSFDKKLFFSLSKSGVARVFSAESGDQMFYCQFPKNTVFYIKLSRLNKYLLVFDVFEKVMIWNLAENFEEFQFSKYGEDFISADFTCDDRGIVLTGRNGNILVKTFENFEDDLWFKGHKESVICVSVNNDGQLFATGSADCKVRVWNFTKIDEKTVFKGHENEIIGVEFSNNPKYLVSGSSDGIIKVWNILERFEEFSISPEISSLKRFEISPSSDLLFLLASDDQLKILDLEDRCEKSSFLLTPAESNNFEVLSATFSVYEDSISFISSSGSLNLLSFKPLNNRRNLKFLKKCPQSFSNDCKFYACFKGNSEIIVYNLKKENVFNRFSTEKEVNFLLFTQDSNFMVVGFEDILRIYNLIEKKEEFSINQCFTEVFSAFLVFSHIKNSWFLSLCFEKRLEIYKNERIIFKDSEFRFSSSEVQVKADLNLNILNRVTEKVKVFDIITEGFNEILEKDNEKLMNFNLDPNTVFHGLFLNPMKYLNIFSSLESKDYQSFELNFDRIQISNLQFTALHILSYLDKSEICQSLLRERNPVLLTDIFGHSPLFYSLIKNHQRTVNIFLLHISCTPPSSPVFSSNIFNLRNDFTDIIQNSSTFLQNFLLICMEPNKQIKPTLLSLPSSRYVHISKSSNPFPQSIFTLSWQRSIKLIHPKTCYIPLPFSLGSPSTLSLVKSIESCSNDSIFKSEFVQSYLLALWKKDYLIVFVFSLLLWVNLIWIAFIVEDHFYLTAFAVLLLVNNILLMIWEGLLIKHQGLRYYLDLWNVLDFFRILLTTVWVIMKFFDKELTGIVWFVVLLNVIRGLIGFRAFDLTRFYIRLIYKSLSDISSFMLIFIYSILSFGLLNATSQNNSIGFESLWMDSFAIIYGDKTAMFDSEFGFQYVTFVLATWINVVFLLKIIISIFGNSFSVFKDKAEIYNFQEMAEVLVEMNQVFSSFRKNDEIGFLHAGGIWDGQSIERQKSGSELEINNFVDQFRGLVSKINSFEKKLAEIRKND